MPHILTVAFDKDTMEMIEREAQRLGISKSEYIRRNFKIKQSSQSKEPKNPSEDAPVPKDADEDIDFLQEPQENDIDD